jgi:hypothetical protein
LVAAPIRLADPGVAALLTAGDVVDVVAVDGHGRATVVASETVVVEAPAPGNPGSFGAPSSDVVVVGVPPATGVALAAAGSTGVLSVLLHPNG